MDKDKITEIEREIDVLNFQKQKLLLEIQEKKMQQTVDEYIRKHKGRVYVSRLLNNVSKNPGLYFVHYVDFRLGRGKGMNDNLGEIYCSKEVLILSNSSQYMKGHTCELKIIKFGDYESKFDLINSLRDGSREISLSQFEELKEKHKEVVNKFINNFEYLFQQ